MIPTANRPNVIGNVGRVGAVIAIAITLCAISAAAQTAKEVKGATPLVAVPNEAPARLIVDPPIPEQLVLGRVFIQYRTENLRIRVLPPQSAKGQSRWRSFIRCFNTSAG